MHVFQASLFLVFKKIIDLISLSNIWAYENILMIHKLLQGIKVILASASPRRRAIFELLGLSPLVVPANIHEPITNEAPYVQVMKHAKNKALAISAKMDAETIVIGSDTIVVLNGQIMGKPDNPEQAADYLRQLSGNSHKVYTGLCIAWRSQCLFDYERSTVTFAQMSEADIREYVATKEPMDKAGAYGIQGYGAQFVSSIRGCYFNVMGFPINKFYDMLRTMFSSNTSDTKI